MPSRAVLGARIEKKKGPPQTRRSALLNMPIDLIREITNQLSIADTIVFATTCRAIRNTTGRGQFPPDGTEENQEERFEYLASMSRDMPDHWVCEECMRHHRIDTADTPSNCRPTCPLAAPYGRYNRPLQLSIGDDYELGRRHVQLALKYTRMGDSLLPSHRQYLQHLTAARHYCSSGPWEKEANVAIKVEPRIVDSRFLLRTICEYRRPYHQPTRELIAAEAICPHQQLFPPEDVPWTRGAFSNGLRRFHYAVDESFETLEKEVCGHCPYCPTDFSIITTNQSVRLSVWMDLGTESSPLDPVWRSFVHNSELPPGEEVENNAPGRVRELYSRGEE
ncbi:hypothetical protein ACQKWADRAFT_26991 [Trichoderma austrokoningii]